jgi:predicted transcriptional regulator
MNETTSPNYIELAVGIVSAFVTNNSIPPAELPALIGTVHTALKQVANGGGQPREELKPAVPIKKSITADYVICLEDGRKLKSLKRHLRSAYGLTPDQYRAKWGLEPDYPMVAPNYAKKRSELAKSMGLGQKRKNAGKQRRKAA